MNVRTNQILKITGSILFLLLAYWPISGMQFAMKYDMMDWFYPMRYFIGECLQNGILPTWNPYINLGYPIHVDPQSGALYPIVWVFGYLFGYSVYTLQAEFILHILLGFWGMQKLARILKLNQDTALLVGITYACCGFFTGNAQHLSWIISAAWVPYILAYYLRLIQSNNWQDALWLALTAHLLLVGGYPAFSIILFYGLGLAFLIHLIRQLWQKQYNPAKRFLFNNILFALVFLTLSSTFLKHFIEAMPLMVRTEKLSLTEIQLLPFSPQALLTFLVPATIGGNLEFFETDSSMANAYIGIIALIFFLSSIRWQISCIELVLFGIGLFCLLAAMGEHFFLRGWLYHYVPLMDVFRYPALFRLFTIIPFLLLFGFAFQRYVDRPEGIQVPANKKKHLLGLNILILCLVGSFLLYAVTKGDLSFAELHPESTSGWLPSASSVSDFINRSNNSEMIVLQAPLQLLLLILLLWTLIKLKRHRRKTAVIVLILFDLFIATQLTLPITAISDTTSVAAQQRMRTQPKGFPIPQKRISDVIHQGGRDFYPTWFNQNILRKEIAHNGYNNLKFKAYRNFKKQATHMDALQHPLLYLSVKINTGDSIIINEFKPTRILATGKTSGDSEVTFLQYAYPGWKARVNNKEIETYIKDDIFLAFRIPKGKQQIQIQFSPPFYKGFLWISFGGLVLLLLSGIVTTLKVKKKNSA